MTDDSDKTDPLASLDPNADDFIISVRRIAMRIVPEAAKPADEMWRKYAIRLLSLVIHYVVAYDSKHSTPTLERVLDILQCGAVEIYEGIVAVQKKRVQALIDNGDKEGAKKRESVVIPQAIVLFLEKIVLTENCDPRLKKDAQSWRQMAEETPRLFENARSEAIHHLDWCLHYEPFAFERTSTSHD